ncbi:MAG: YHYH protein [Flavicella sp.]
MYIQNIFKINHSLLLIFLILSSIISCDSDKDEVNDTSGNVDDIGEVTDDSGEPTETSYDIQNILTLFDASSEVVTYEITGDKVVFTTSNLPKHKTPYYQGTEWSDELYEAYNGTNSSFRLNPNRIGAQNITFSIPLHPKAATINEATPMGPIGISRNGVVFFNQYAAGGAGLDNEINSFDQYLGHPTGQSVYHYHVEPSYVTEVHGANAFLGLLADGFPVYGPEEGSETLSSDDLDDFHGHFGVTDEFPDGIYHYHVTADPPYINGDGFYGTPGNINN